MTYTDLLNKMKLPPLYERSEHPFWNDEHISAGMLAAHLDPNMDAASRRPEFLDRSVEWIASLLPPEEYPKLLDLGCGPGLYGQRFAKAGYSVTGVDLSPRSIEYAKQTAESEGLSIDYRVADYLNLDLRTQYDAAVLIYCDYSALSTEDRLTLLSKAHDHLRPGGKLLMDIDSEYAFKTTNEYHNWSLCEQGGYWSAEPHLVIEQECRFCDNVVLHQAGVATADNLRMYYIWKTHFSPDSIRTEVESAGFKVLEYRSDVAGAAYSDTSPTITVLLERD